MTRGEIDESSRATALWEIVSVTFSLSALIWVVLPLGDYDLRVGAAFVTILLLYAFASHRARGETLDQIGWRADNFAAALRAVFVLALLFAAPLLLAALALRGRDAFSIDAARRAFFGDALAAGGDQLWRRWPMLFSGLAQQYLLYGFINLRAEVIWGRGPRSAFAVAAVFALLHAPNGWLMLATFAEGFGWAYIFQRTPNLFALAVSHALMTRLLIFAFTDERLRGLRVGFKYFQ